MTTDEAADNAGTDDAGTDDAGTDDAGTDDAAIDTDRTALAAAHLRAARSADHLDPVEAFNPYWDRNGTTFADPDGYRVVRQHAAWR